MDTRDAAARPGNSRRRSPSTGRSRRSRALVALALAAGVAATVQVAPAAAITLGPPSFDAPVSYDSHATNTGAIAIADLNGDGKPDVATVSQLRGEPNYGLAVFLGTGDAGLGTASNYPAPVIPFPSSTSLLISVRIGDLNGDGKPDIVSEDSENAIVLVWINDGTGHFAPATQVPLDPRPGCGLSSDNHCIADFPADTAIGDFDEDGKPDLVTANADSDNLSLARGNGDGTFQTPVLIGLGAAKSPQAVEVGDVNGDHHPDLVVASPGFGDTAYITVLLGDGHGGFAAPENIAPPIAFPQHIKLADLNGDGKLDIAMVNDGFEGTAGVMLGDGTGGFVAGATFDAGQNPGAIAVADVNGDGHPDLTITDSSTDDLSIYDGDGSGVFGGPATYGLGGAVKPKDVAVADLNGDGLPEVVTANDLSDDTDVDDVTVLRNSTSLDGSAAATLDAKVPAFLAIEGGSASFGDVVPRFTEALYGATASLNVATTSPSGMRVTVQADPSNAHLGGLGDVTILQNRTIEYPDSEDLAWRPFTDPVLMYVAHVPVNTTTTQRYQLDVPAGTVLRRGDTYSEPITYVATASVP